MAPKVPKAGEAARLLEEAEAAKLNIETQDAALKAGRAAVDMYRDMGDRKGLAQALGVVVGVLLRQHFDEPHEATKLAEDELAAFRAAGDRGGEAAMKVALAEINMDGRGDAKREEALEFAKDAKAAFIDLDDKAMEAKATDMVAAVLIKRCDKAAGPKCAREALKFSREAASLYQELGDKLGEARALYMLFSAKMYSEAPWKDGLKYGKEAAALFAAEGSKWWQATVLRTIADWAQMKGQGQDGLQFAESALEIFQELETTTKAGWEASSLATVVGAYAAKGEEGSQAAVKVAQEGAGRLRASGDKAAEAQALTLLAGAHLLNEDTEEALKAAGESLQLYRDLGNRHCEARVLVEISQIHAKAENDAEALNSLEDAITVAQELKDVRFQARSLSGIVRLHLSQRDMDKALEAGADAIALYQICSDQEGEGVVRLNMASAHMAKGAFDVAAGEAEEARGLFQDIENKTREAQSLYFLAEANTRSEKHELALHAATTAKAMYQKVGNKVEEANMLHLMAQANLSIAEKAGASKQKEEQKRAKRLYTSALKAAKEGLAIAKKLAPEKDPKKVLQANLLSAVAQGQGVLGKYKEALKSANEAMKISTDTMDRQGECSALVLQAQVHNWGENTAEARAVANKALDLAQKIKDEYLEQLAAFILHELEPQAFGGGAAAAQQAEAADAGPADSAAVEASALGPYTGPDMEALMPKVSELALTLLSTDELEQDTPLMDSGLDSLSMVQFRNTLQQQFPGVPMPASLVFDHPSVRAVSQNIAEELKAAHEAGRPLM